jgi:hypothetical protein
VDRCGRVDEQRWLGEVEGWRGRVRGRRGRGDVLFCVVEALLGRDEEPQGTTVDHELQARALLAVRQCGGSTELQGSRALPSDRPPLARFWPQERDPLGVDDHRQVADDGLSFGSSPLQVDIVHAEAPVPEPE